MGEFFSGKSNEKVETGKFKIHHFPVSTFSLQVRRPPYSSPEAVEEPRRTKSRALGGLKSIEWPEISFCNYRLMEKTSEND